MTSLRPLRLIIALVCLFGSHYTVVPFIESIQFRGARRVPQDTLRRMIFSKVGRRL
jgi:hypothetical protein